MLRHITFCYFNPRCGIQKLSTTVLDSLTWGGLCICTLCGYSFNSTTLSSNNLLISKTSCFYNFKTGLGGGTCLCDINMHAGCLVNCVLLHYPLNLKVSCQNTTIIIILKPIKIQDVSPQLKPEKTVYILQNHHQFHQVMEPVMAPVNIGCFLQRYKDRDSQGAFD